MIKLTKLEQETIITFNEAESFAEVYTHNGRLKTRLSELHQQRPKDVQHQCSDHGSESYRIPKKWIKVNPSRVMTEEQKAARRAVMERSFKTKITDATRAD